MKRGVIMNTIHPYVGITRIRYEGIISARTSEHPLIKSAAKVHKNPRTAKRFGDFESINRYYLIPIRASTTLTT